MGLRVGSGTSARSALSCWALRVSGAGQAHFPMCARRAACGVPRTEPSSQRISDPCATQLFTMPQRLHPLTIPRLVQEVQALRTALRYKEVHLLGSKWRTLLGAHEQ
jgi:hypothetical protein